MENNGTGNNMKFERKGSREDEYMECEIRKGLSR